MQVIKLFDEVALMTSLKKDTLLLLKHTDFIEAIKRLILAHDIISLNLDIQERFRANLEDLPIWDDAALSDLKTIRRELIVYYQDKFQPAKTLRDYCDKMGHFFHVIEVRKNLENR